MSVYDGVKIAELDEAIRSIQAQTLTDFELLIMQDDIRRIDLRECLRQRANNDRRIKLFTADVRSGLAVALNRLLLEARAPYLARMDADDVSFSDRLTRQVAFLEEHADIMVLGTLAKEIDAEGRVVYEKTLPISDADIRMLHCYRDPFVHPSVMFRRELFAIVGPYSEDTPSQPLEDTELWSRTLLAGIKTANVPEFLYGFRVDSRFYDRRGGISLAWRELLMRWSYVRRAGLPCYYYLPALGVAFMRLGPKCLRRTLYTHLRRGRVVRRSDRMING